MFKGVRAGMESIESRAEGNPVSRCMYVQHCMDAHAPSSTLIYRDEGAYLGPIKGQTGVFQS